MSVVMWLVVWVAVSVVFGIGCALGSALCQRRSWDHAREAGYRLGFEVGQQAPKGSRRPELWIEHTLPDGAEHTARP